MGTSFVFTLIYILLFLVGSLASGVVLWLVSRLSSDPPGFTTALKGGVAIVVSNIAASIIGSFLPLPLMGTLISIILITMVMMKFGRFSGLYAFFAGVLFSVVLQFMTLAVISMIF